MSRRHTAVAALAALFLVAGLAAHAQNAPAPQPTDFPRYPSIEPNVRFWVRVYSEWGLGQVVIHDMERPELIYEVLALPGTIEERYSDEQRELIRTRVEGWRDKLRTLEVAIAAGQELGDEQKGLALLVTTNAGSEAIRGACDRVRMQRGVRERFRRGLEISQRYDALIRQTLREEGVPEALAYLPHVESSFQSRAVSSAGAVGAWQFTRSAGRRYMHVTSAFDERLDAVLAARGAARYLKDAYAKLGQWPLALTSYNHGVGGMTQAVAQLGQDYEKIFLEYDGRLFGFASRNFYPEFLAAVEVASQPATFFPDGLSLESPLDYDRTTLTRASSPRVIARQHGLSVEELAALNPAWTARALRSGLSIPENATVWLPRGTLAQRVPASTTAAAETVTEYVVRPGDTLVAIASHYAVEIADLCRWNGLPAGSTSIEAGQRLIVSGEPAAAIEPAKHEHEVGPGDTLSTIARMHGLSIEELRSLNSMGPGDTLIRPGDKLVVSGATTKPAATRKSVHVVRRGETLMRIATSYGVRLADLLHVNRLDSRSVIHPGQRIVIPFLPH